MNKFAVTCMLAVCVTASASELSKLLEETTEIATKTRINADYVPGTVNIIRGEELKALGILNLNQPNALDMIVGMDSSVNALRGSGAMYGGQGVKIKWLLNGRAINSQIWSGSITGRGVISFPVLVSQIDRIEIIRGPDSAVYGDNAIFGVINIITKSENNDVSASFGYQNGGKFGKSATANIYKEQGDFALSVSTSAFDNDGYPMYVGETGAFGNSTTGNHTPGYGPGNLPNGAKGYNFLIDASYGDYKAWINRLETKSAQGAFGIWYPTDMLPKDDGKLVRREAYTQFGLQKEIEYSDISVTPKVGVDIYEFNLKDYVDVSSIYMNNATGVDGVRKSNYRELKKYAAVDADYKTGSHHIAGGLLLQATKNVEDSKYKNYQYVGPWPTSDIWKIVSEFDAGNTAVQKNTHRDQKALYLQDSWDVTDKITITYGARYDKFEGDIKSNGWSPRVAVVYRADENNILKAQYARAFRPPTFAEMADRLDTIKSETVDTLELGHIYKKDKITVKNTLFESRIYDMITFDDWTYYTINLPNVGRIQGLEMEGKYSSESYELGFNQAFYKTDRDQRSYMSPDNNKLYIYKDGSFPLAPTYMANIFVKFNQNGSYPTTVWYHYIGAKKRKSEFNTEYVQDSSKGVSNGSVPPQYYINVTQQFKGIAKDMDLSVGVQNLLGKTQKTLYMPLNQPNNQDIPYMGQMFWMNLSYRF